MWDEFSSLIHTTIRLSRKGLNDYPGFGAAEAGFHNARLFFFLPFPLLNIRPEALGYRTQCLSGNRACANPRAE